MMTSSNGDIGRILLSGQPTEVETEITVNFTLSH